MPETRLARFIARASMALGLAVGIVSIAVWNFGLTIHSTPWLMRVAFAKLGLAVAAGMIGIGAVVLRYIRRAERGRDSDSALSDEELRAIDIPVWDPTVKRGDPERVRLTKRPDIPLP